MTDRFPIGMEWVRPPQDPVIYDPSPDGGMPSNSVPIEFWNCAVGWERRAKVAEAKVAAVEALIGYGYSITRSADNGGGVAIVIEETAIEEALATEVES